MSLKNLALGAALAVALLVAPAGAQQAQSKPADEQVQVIEMTAKKYEYNPGEIHVKVGAKVQLKIRALDRTHGFKIKLHPQGSSDKEPAGLRFTDPQNNWKLEKDQVRVIEFVAERPGTYLFECSVFCGLGHGGMEGKLIVEQ